VALPLVGIQASRGFSWRRLHDVSANLSLLLIGLHVALHWQWIVSMVKRFAWAPRREQSMPVSAHRASKEA
jgi:hypothetical protein